MVEDHRRAAPPPSDPHALAVIALICAIGGIFCFVTAIPAIVLGHMVRGQASRTGERRGVTLATTALVIGYGYVAVLVLVTGSALVMMPKMLKGVQDQMRKVEEKAAKLQQEAAADEARRNAPAPVERGPLPARVTAGLPVSMAAFTQEPERYRPLAYARAQVCRGEGDARERFVAAIEGSRGVDGDELREVYRSWVAGCGTPEPCAWLRKRALEAKGALRTELERQLEECPARAGEDEQPAFSWTQANPFGGDQRAPDQLADCGADEKLSAGERYSCLERLARSDRARASKLAAALLAGGAVRKVDLGAADEADDASLYALVKPLADHPTLAALEQRLQGLGLLPGAARAATAVPPVTVEELLEAHGRLTRFDVETGMFPNMHDGLAADLWRLTGLAPIAFEEIPPVYRDDKEEGDYRLRAFTAQHEYSVIAKNHGDWYDVDAVLRLLDRVSSDQNSELRSHVLPAYDQTATVIMAPPAAVAAARQLGLLFSEPSAASAETHGKHFEAEVLRRMGNATP